MPLITIHASAPWGPVSLRTAADIGEVLTWGMRPAATVDVGKRDPADVLREALRLLPAPMDATGLIPATVEKAQNSVTEAVSRVSATHVAADPAKAVPGRPESHGGPIVLGGEAGSAFSDQDVPVPGSLNAGINENERIVAPHRRRPGQEVDVRAIRAGLNLSQPEFSRAYGIPLATLRDWEQGRRTPDGAGRSLLLIVERYPLRTRKVLEEYGELVPTGVVEFH